MSHILLNALHMTHVILSRTLWSMDAFTSLLWKVKIRKWRETIPNVNHLDDNPRYSGWATVCRAETGDQVGDYFITLCGNWWSPGLGQTWGGVVRVLMKAEGSKTGWVTLCWAAVLIHVLLPPFYCLSPLKTLSFHLVFLSPISNTYLLILLTNVYLVFSWCESALV